MASDRKKPYLLRKGRKKKHVTPSDLRREAARRDRPAAAPNHAAVVRPGSTPRPGPPIRPRAPKGDRK